MCILFSCLHTEMWKEKVLQEVGNEKRNFKTRYFSRANCLFLVPFVAFLGLGVDKHCPFRLEDLENLNGIKFISI